MTQKVLRSFGSKALLIATMLGGASLAASAAAPQIQGYNVKPGNILFPAQCDSLKVFYDRNDILSATYELRQNGKVVFSGKDTGKSQGLDHSIFAINSTASNNTREVCIALAVDKTLVPGDVEFAVTSVTYLDGDDEVTATDLGSVTWNLTDMPRIGGANPLWHPDKALKDLKAGTSVSFTFPDMNFGSYKDEALGKTVYVKTQITGGKISFLQDGEVKTVIDVVKPEPAAGALYNNSLPAIKPTDEQLAPLSSGLCEIRLTELSYISPATGELVVVNDPEGIPTTWTKTASTVVPERGKTYVNCVSTTKIVSESIVPLETELLSYYTEDDQNGIISYTFSEPLAAGTSGNGDFVAKFRIGDANHEFDQIVPHTLSEDKKTLTLDLRGLSNGIPTLADNFNFVDDDGNSYIPKTCTICIESGLFDAKGTKVSVFCQFDANQAGRYLDGQLWRIYPYKEISFATPALSDALFYSSDAPESKNPTMVNGSNMMDVTVSNSEVIASAEPAYLIGETVVPTTATHEGDLWSVAIPEAVAANGVENLKFTLLNVTYNKVDGNKHEVNPLDLTALAPAKELTTLADVVALEPNSEVVLNTEGLLVTMGNEAFTSMEDVTAAVMVIDITTDMPASFLTEGTLLTGKICGTYAGGNVFLIDPAKSEYTVTAADASTGFDVTDMADCANLDFRLLTFSAADGFEIIPFDDETIAIINGTLPVVDVTGALPAGYVCPEKIQSITGVYYSAEGNDMLMIRSANDIVEANTIPEVADLTELKATEVGKKVSINLDNAVVTAVFDEMGLVLLQDNGGAINLVSNDDNGITAFERGAVITGTIVGIYGGDGNFLIDLDESKFTQTVADVTYGHELSLDEVFDLNNQYRLVTFKQSDDTPIVNEDYALQVGENIFVYDMMEVLGDETFEKKRIDSVTGILYFPGISIMADGADAPAYAFLIPRDENDIATTTVTGVDSIFGEIDETAPVYNLNGQKVREAGEGIKGLAKGIYITNGKKVVIF